MSNSPIRFPLGQRLRSAKQNLAAVGQDGAAGATGSDALEFRGLIGAAIEARRMELVGCGEDLNRILVDRRTNSFIEEQLHRLQQQTCRIAIIGQVKAGKSSFINAFIGKPDLLPTDVNPWTTAVTHLHFAKRASPLEVAAEFTFFDRDEWHQLVNGGGRIRELTRRLVPGFEVELLHAHVELMQRRSEQRLGSALEGLLGAKHSFPDLSRDVIERYVCSGLIGTVDMSGQGKGIFSDVTKSADLYFDQGSFGCATTIIDTPGTNDPFLVRDEITRRALETADIYIVVLTARQPLSTADLALLRILRGLHKDRIIVFINRVDELGSPAEDSPLILQHVRRGLQREFPGTEFPIIAGSAFWGNSALAEVSPDNSEIVTSQLRAYAEQLAQDHSATISLGPKSTTQQVKNALLICSGIPRLKHALSGIMWRHHANVTKQIAASFGELSRLAEISVQHEINQLSDPAAMERARVHSNEEELRQIKGSLADYQRLTVTLHGHVMDLQAKSEQIIKDEIDRISDALREAVLEYGETECASLGQAMLEGQRVRVWRCQTGAIRQKLETILLNTYREAQQKLVACEASVLPALKQLILKFKPDWYLPGGDLRAEFDRSSPSLAALSNVVAVDLEEPWWKMWWQGGRSSAERLQELDRLIRSEFFPIAEMLTQAARTQLRNHQQNLIQRSTLIYISMAGMLEEQSRTKIARSRELIETRDKPVARLTDSRTHDARMAELTELLTRAKDLTRKLGDLQHQVGEASPA